MARNDIRTAPMSENQTDPADLCIVPQPQSLQILEGDSELCADARLVTANVLPLQRKTIRSVLAAAGVRVVANKKKFIIEIHVVPADELEMEDVPPQVRDDFYELQVRNNVVTVRTSTQVGALWGAQTLGWLYRSGGRETFSPNFRIRDWSRGFEPGVFVDMARGGRYMLSADWEQLMDRMSFFKMKHLATRVFGRPPSQGAEQGDLLCLPSGEEEEDVAEPMIRKWFSVGNREWQADPMHQQIIADRMWGDLVTFANERGLTLAAVVDPFGRYSQVPLVRPELSTVDKGGNPTGKSLCLSNPDTRTFLQEFFAQVLQRDYRKGIHPFHLDVSEAPEGTQCHCSACAKADPEQLCRDHQEWFTTMLLDGGVPEVWVWDGDQALRARDGDRKMLKHPSVEAGANLDALSEAVEFVRVDDNDPLDFVPLARFAARMWHADNAEKSGVSEECVADVVLGNQRGAAFLGFVQRLQALDEEMKTLSGISFFDGRHIDGRAIDIERVGKDSADSAVDDLQIVAEKGRAIHAEAYPMLTEEDRGTPAEIIRTLAGFGLISAALADFVKGIADEDRAAARKGIETGIVAAQDVMPRWLENIFVDEFSQVVRQFEG